MHREDKTNYLLYIEPTKDQKSKEPNTDGLAEKMETLLNNAVIGIGNYSNLECEGYFQAGDAYKGSHVTDCGERSSNKDYLLENEMITNSLAPFYLRWYRDAIPETEMIKVKELFKLN